MSLLTDIPNILVVLADGKSDYGQSTIDSAIKLHATDVIVFTVGIDNSLYMIELKAIASDPDRSHLSILQDSTDLCLRGAY